MSILSEKTCKPCEGGIAPLNKFAAKNLLSSLNNWGMDEATTEIKKTFKFKGFYRTMAFVNAVAWIANQENHHPDLEVSYGHCTVRFQTHAINGLSENDFICAAKIDNL